MKTWKKSGSPRKTRGLKPITASLQHLYVEKLSQAQLQTYQLFTHWKDIVGEDVSALLTPIKTSYNPRKKHEILYVAPLKEGGGFFFQYQKDTLLASINEYFGHAVFGHIQLATQSVPASKKIPSEKESDQEKTPLPEDLEDGLSKVNDPDLRKKLESFYKSFSSH